MTGNKQVLTYLFRKFCLYKFYLGNFLFLLIAIIKNKFSSIQYKINLKTVIKIDLMRKYDNGYTIWNIVNHTLTKVEQTILF